MVVGAGVGAQRGCAGEGGVTVETRGPCAAAVVARAGGRDRALATPPGERLRDGVRVVIAGPPNSGKSTLLNALAERDAAIVSPIISAKSPTISKRTITSRS